MNKQILVILVCIFSVHLTAQIPDSIKDLPAEQVEVIKLFQARLENALKINVAPEPPAQRALQRYEYQVSIKPLEIEYVEPSIKPLAMPKTEMPKKYYGFAEALAGNLNTIDAEVGLHYMTRQETEFKLLADYLTQNNSNEILQQYSSLSTLIGIRHHLNELVSFELDGGYDLENVTFYGSPLPLQLSEDNAIYYRSLGDLKVGFGISNSQVNEYDIDYRVRMDYDNFRLLSENLAENNFKLDLDFIKGLNENFSIKFNGLVDVSSIIDTSTFSYNNYHLTPGFRYHTLKGEIDADLDIVFAPENQIYYLPNVTVGFNFLNYALMPYLTYRSEVQKNNMRPLFEYNPFLSTSIARNSTNSIYRLYSAGLKGKFSQLNYDLSIGVGLVEDLLLFRNLLTIDGLRQFEIQQDNSDLTRVQFELGYEYAQFNIRGNLIYNFYDIVALHLPSYIANVEARYSTLKDKLKVSTTLHLRDGVTIFNDEDVLEDLPYMLDLSVGAGYDITKRLSVRASVNNLLASEYQQWYDYSNFGLNATAGLHFKF